MNLTPKGKGQLIKRNAIYLPTPPDGHDKLDLMLSRYQGRVMTSVPCEALWFDTSPPVAADMPRGVFSLTGCMGFCCAVESKDGTP